MPVIPEHVPPFQIKAPTTSGDEGRPSTSLWTDARRVLEFVHDERHLVAERLYLDVKRRLDEYEQLHHVARKEHGHGKRMGGFKIGHHSNKKAKNEHEKWIHEAEQVKSLFAQNEKVLSRMLSHCRLFRNAKQNLSTDEDWTYACHHFGITTYYRREADGSLSIKLDGELKDVPLFEQICVLKEIDLHYRWAPFCSSSMTIADLDKIDTVGWFLIGTPSFGLARDGCFRAVGCDCLEEDGTILLAAQGIQDRKPGSSPPEDTCLSDDPIIEKLEIPPVPTRRGSGRMTIKKFEAMITITSPTSANTRIVANVDPNLPFLPQSLLEFVMKHMAGVLLAKLQGAAKKASRNPASNEHAKRMRTEKAFYKVWLMTKFRSLCDQKGWEMPHVTAFDYTEKESRLFNRAVTFNGTVTEASVREGLSAASEGQAYASGGDSISELSGITSLRSKNRLATYLHEMEERTRRKKEEKIAAMRSMAAARLKPTGLKESKLERLNQLKAARARVPYSKVTYTIAEEDENGDSSHMAIQAPSLRERVTGRLHSHPIWFRAVFMLSLVTLQFSLLHLGLMHVTNGVIFGDRIILGFLSLDDLAVVALMLVCGIVDYLICFAAFIYTFSSLELGSKSGSRIKNYYADKVALVARTKSVAILGVALMTAWMKVTARVVSAFGLRLWTNPRHALLAPTSGFFRSLRWLRIPTKVSLFLPGVESEEKTETYLHVVFDFLYSTAVNFAQTTITYLSSYGIISETNVYINAFREMIEPDSNETSFCSWRDDAFDTATILFTYSSIFLLTFLVLFSLAAVASRPEKPEKCVLAASFRNQTSAVSELSEERESYTNPFGDHADESIEGDRAAPPLSLSTPASSALSSRRRRFRPLLGRVRRGQKAETAGQPWSKLHPNNLLATP